MEDERDMAGLVGSLAEVICGGFLKRKSLKMDG